MKIKITNKTILFFAAIVIGVATLWFTNGLVKDLKDEERTKVKIWAKATEQTTDIENLNEDISFIFEVINHNNTIPVILTDAQGKILYHKNFSPKKVKKAGYLEGQLLLMIQNIEPIIFEYAERLSHGILTPYPMKRFNRDNWGKSGFENKETTSGV